MMASINVHCADCIKTLGEPFRAVHEYLDEFATEYPPVRHGTFHRQFRHNVHGLAAVESRWGRAGREAAKIHIDRDDGVEFGGESSLESRL